MSASKNVLNTPVEWAQRKNCIYVNIRVSDLKEPVIKVEKDRLVFNGKGGDGKQHELDLQLFGPVKPDDSKYMVQGRGAEIVMMKENADAPYWKRLLKDEQKQHWLKVDFNKWQDEDGSDDESGLGAGGANFEEMMRQMGGLGGMPSLGDNMPADLGDGFDEDDEDSDDEKLPELEEADDKK